eukprot:433138_1
MMTNCSVPPQRYRINMKRAQCKARMHITDHIDACIYFYPNRTYMASDIQLELSKDYQHTNATIQFIWKCGDQIKEGKMWPIHKYLPTTRALGPNHLFDKEYVTQHDCVISISCHYHVDPQNKKPKACATKSKCDANSNDNAKDIPTMKAPSNAPSTSITTSNTNNKKKRKIQHTMFDYPQFKKMKLNKEKKLDKDINGSSDWKFNPQKLQEAITAISDQLGSETSFGLLPTIDCFASDMNHQEICTNWITKETNFFSKQFDDPSYWKKRVAWANPPYKSRKMTSDCMNKFISRKMRGYVCVPHRNEQWCGDAKRLCKTYIQMRTKNRYGIFFPSSTGNKYGTGKCPFDLIIFYFDFQS